MSGFSFYVGIDLGNTQQAICVLDCKKKEPVVRRVVETHDVLEVLSKAIGATAPAAVAVAVEDRNNVIVDALLELGFSVFSINPKQADRFRERETASGAKDDKRDARTLARALITDELSFRSLTPLSEQEGRMRAVSQIVAALDDEHRQLSNKLRAVLLRYFPALLSICEGADQPWFWALVLLLGDVDHARKVPAAAVTKLLKATRKRSVSADDVKDLLARPLIQPPAWLSAEKLKEATGLIERLRLIDSQRELTTSRRKNLVDELAEPKHDGSASDVAILLSMPGIGEKTAATLFAEVGPLLRGGNLGLLRAVAGVAPVTTRSGKMVRVSMRHACNPRLREALHHAAFAAAVQDEGFKKYRAKLNAANHESARALRSIADKMLHILVAMFATRTLYSRRPKPVAS